jgi:hypothetical protein
MRRAGSKSDLSKAGISGVVMVGTANAQGLGGPSLYRTLRLDFSARPLGNAFSNRPEAMATSSGITRASCVAV